MLITETHVDVPTQHGGQMRMLANNIQVFLHESDVLIAKVGIFLFHPTIPNYPKAKFPGVVVFSEIYQGE